MFLSKFLSSSIRGKLVSACLPKENDAKSNGFTLIELMVVIIVLGLLVGIIGFKFLGRTEEARRTAAALQIRAFVNALQLYKLDNGRYPSTAQGLKALVEKPSSGRIPKKWTKGGYMEGRKIPLDPWGNPYVFVSPGSGGREVEIKSLGADGQEGGEEDNADVESWKFK